MRQIKICAFADNAAGVDKGKQTAIPVIMIFDGNKEDFGAPASILFHAGDAAAICDAIMAAANIAEAGRDVEIRIPGSSTEVEELDQ